MKFEKFLLFFQLKFGSEQGLDHQRQRYYTWEFVHVHVYSKYITGCSMHTSLSLCDLGVGIGM